MSKLEDIKNTTEANKKQVESLTQESYGGRFRLAPHWDGTVFINAIENNKRVQINHITVEEAIFLVKALQFIFELKNE